MIVEDLIDRLSKLNPKREVVIGFVNEHRQLIGDDTPATVYKVMAIHDFGNAVALFPDVLKGNSIG